MNPYEHLESKQKRKDEKRYFIIDNKVCLCGNGGLYPMIARKGVYIPVIIYNQMKEIFFKYWKQTSNAKCVQDNYVMTCKKYSY